MQKALLLIEPSSSYHSHDIMAQKLSASLQFFFPFLVFFFGQHFLEVKSVAVNQS